MARPSRLYLLSYNSLQSLGWTLALFRLLACLAPPVSVHPAYALAGDLICFLQTCAVLETVHAAIGLVPTSPFLAFLQWGGRTHFVLALLRQIPEVQGSPSVFITFMAWSISEVIRYSHYALTALKVCPAWLTYLRDRAGGYTRLLRTRIRIGDAAPMAYIEFVDRENELREAKPATPPPPQRAPLDPWTKSRASQQWAGPKVSHNSGTEGL